MLPQHPRATHRRMGSAHVRLLSTRPRRPARRRDPAGRCVPHLVRPGVGWRRRVPGAVRASSSAASLLRKALTPDASLSPVAESDPAGAAAAAGAGGGAGRVGGADDPDPAARPAGRHSPTRAWPAWATSRTGSWPTPRRTTCAPARRSVRCSTSGRCRCRASSTSRSWLLVFGVRRAVPPPRSARALRIFFVVLLSALTIASFVYAIFAHNADQSTAYYNSFARAWELLLGALAGRAGARTCGGRCGCGRRPRRSRWRRSCRAAR